MLYVHIYIYKVAVKYLNHKMGIEKTKNVMQLA